MSFVFWRGGRFLLSSFIGCLVFGAVFFDGFEGSAFAGAEANTGAEWHARTELSEKGLNDTLTRKLTGLFYQENLRVAIRALELSDSIEGAPSQNGAVGLNPGLIGFFQRSSYLLGTMAAGAGAVFTARVAYESLKNPLTESHHRLGMLNSSLAVGLGVVTVVSASKTSSLFFGNPESEKVAFNWWSDMPEDSLDRVTDFYAYVFEFQKDASRWLKAREAFANFPEQDPISTLHRHTGSTGQPVISVSQYEAAIKVEKLMGKALSSSAIEGLSADEVLKRQQQTLDQLIEGSEELLADEFFSGPTETALRNSTEKAKRAREKLKLLI